MWQARNLESGQSADSGDFILPPNAGRSADSDAVVLFLLTDSTLRFRRALQLDAVKQLRQPDPGLP
jgi:hypothetical protein